MKESPGRRIGRHLRTVREERLLSRPALAERAGVGVATIDHIERGLSARPRRTTLEKLAGPLGVTVEDLIGDTTHPLAEAPALQLEAMYVANAASRRRALAVASKAAVADYVATIGRVVWDVLPGIHEWDEIAADKAKSPRERRVASDARDELWRHVNRLLTMREEAAGADDEPPQEELADFITAHAASA